MTVRILRAQVNWMLGWANDPRLRLLLDRLPELDEYVYSFVPTGDKEGEGLYWAEVDGVVRFYFWSGKPDRGFGGRHYTIRLDDETVVTLKGPWSSGPSVLNNHFPHCMDVSLTDDPGVFERGHTYFAGNVLVDVVREQLQWVRPELSICDNPTASRGPGYIVCRSHDRPKASYYEAVEWGDQPGATGRFLEILHETMLGTEEDQRRFTEEFRNPLWEKHMQPLSLGERFRKEDEFEQMVYRLYREERR